MKNFRLLNLHMKSLMSTCGSGRVATFFSLWCSEFYICSQRFPEVFAAVVDVREMQTVLESVISRTIAENSTLKPRQTKLEEKREEANSFAMLRLVSESSNSTESSAFEKKLAQRYGIRRKDLEMLKRLWIKSVVKKFKRG